MQNFDPETAENHPDIEKQWAVKAMTHAEAYFKLITSYKGSNLKLTKIDDEMYADFRKEWPDLDVSKLHEMKDFKTEKSKAKWRDWIKKYEDKVKDFNFGTILRVDASQDYGPDNAFFVTRTQFYAIEIARNKECFNDVHYKPKVTAQK